jgi:hypothetical protein
MCRYAPSIALIGPKKTSPPQLLGRCCLNIDLFHPLPCRQAGVFLTDLYCMAAGGLPEPCYGCVEFGDVARNGEPEPLNEPNWAAWRHYRRG